MENLELDKENNYPHHDGEREATVCAETLHQHLN
jgi:hypothetical protein